MKRPKNEETKARPMWRPRGCARCRRWRREAEKLDRTDDPVRMYLREMGSRRTAVREGEIAIAKRIEAGRNTMILGCAKAR